MNKDFINSKMLFRLLVLFTLVGVGAATIPFPFLNQDTKVVEAMTPFYHKLPSVPEGN
jgi:hypothetical protein